MNLSLEEKETNINYNDGEKEARIYSCNPALIRKLDKLCEDFPEQFKKTKEDKYSKWYIIPKKFVRIGKPVNITEEQRKAKSEYAKHIRNAVH
jgi:hypothetical protein